MVFFKFDNFSKYRGERGHEKDEIHRHHPKKVRTEGYLPLCHLPLLLLLCQNRGSSLTQPCVTHFESPTGMPSCRPLGWAASLSSGGRAQNTPWIWEFRALAWKMEHVSFGSSRPGLGGKLSRLWHQCDISLHEFVARISWTGLVRGRLAPITI